MNRSFLAELFESLPGQSLRLLDKLLVVRTE